MNKTIFTAFIASISIVGITSCNSGEKSSGTSTEKTETTPSRNGDEIIKKDETKEEVSVNTAKVILSKSGNENSTFDLVRAQVVGQVLTVEIVFAPEKKADGKYGYDSYIQPIEDIYYIDDATAKKVGVLKDDAGVYLANPISSSKKNIYISGIAGPSPISLKFRAPVETSKTISINLPTVGSFDGVPISR